MIKKKNLDDLELVFLDEPWTDEERKKFSAYLKARKLHSPAKQRGRLLTKRKKKQNA